MRTIHTGRRGPGTVREDFFSTRGARARAHTGTHGHTAHTARLPSCAVCGFLLGLCTPHGVLSHKRAATSSTRPLHAHMHMHNNNMHMHMHMCMCMCMCMHMCMYE